MLIGSLMSLQSLFLSVTTPQSAALEAVLRHHKLILEAIQQRTELKGCASEDESLVETVREVWWGTLCFREFYGVHARDCLAPEGGTDSLELLLCTGPAELTVDNSFALAALPALSGWRCHPHFYR